MKDYEHLAARVPWELKRLVELAADVRGVSVSEFARKSLRRSALDVLGQDSEEEGRRHAVA